MPHGLKTKTLRRMLKKKGLKTTGRKATLMKRLHMRGGGAMEDALAAAQKTLDEVNAKKEATQEEKDAAKKAVESAQKAIDDAAAAAANTTLPAEEAEETKEGEGGEEEGGRRRRRRHRTRKAGGRRGHPSRFSRSDKKKERLGF